MVGDHPVRGAGLALGLDTRRLDRGGDQGLEEVDIVIVVLALQHGGDTLQSHARVDRRLGKVEPLARGQLLVLHEDEVPDFNETVSVLVGRTGRSARNMVAMVKEDFGTGAAGTRIAH